MHKKSLVHNFITSLKNILALSISVPLFFIIFLFFEPGTPALAANHPTVKLNNNSKTALGKYLAVYPDKSGILDIDQIKKLYYDGKFIYLTEDSPYIGFTNHIYWSVLTLETEVPGTYYISYEFPLMNSIDLTVITTNFKDTSAPETMITDKISTGFLKPFSSRPVPARNFVFKINAKEDDIINCFFRFENDGRIEFPMQIYNEKNFLKSYRDDQFLMGIYFGIMMIILTVNFLIFVFLKQKLFLLHVTFILTFFIFITLQDGNLLCHFTPFNSVLYPQIVPHSIAAVLIAALLFTNNFLDIKKFSAFLNILNIIISTALLIIFGLAFRLTNGMSIQILTTITLFILPYMIIIVLVAVYKKQQSALYLAFGWILMSFGGIVFALKTDGILPHSTLTNHALHLGSLIYFFIVTFALAKTIFNINNDKISAMSRFSRLEKQFSSIINNSEEIIFILDDNFIINFVNPAVKKHFKIDPKDAIGKPFISFVYTSTKSKTDQETAIIQDKLDNFIIEKRPVRLQADFISKLLYEPKRMQIELQYIEHDGTADILGKAVPVSDDALLPFFISEEQEYSIDNYIDTANEVTTRLTRNLKRYMEESKLNILRIALREIIINAIEHGSLEISYIEKTEALARGNYLHYLAEKRELLKFENRKIRVSSSINCKHAKFTITDSGQGFDYQKYLDFKDGDDTGANSHGRGIIMTRHIFDKIIYNSSGNSVTLIKRLSS